MDPWKLIAVSIQTWNHQFQYLFDINFEEKALNIYRLTVFNMRSFWID